MRAAVTRAALVVAALLLAAVHARAADTVLMVTIDDFAQAGRERAVNEARLAALTGTMELYADVEPGMSARDRKSREGRIMWIREKIIRSMGIVPRRHFPFGGCVRQPSGEAYAIAYADASDKYFKNKLGAGFREKIEAEVRRKAKARGWRQPPRPVPNQP